MNENNTGHLSGNARQRRKHFRYLRTVFGDRLERRHGGLRHYQVTGSPTLGTHFVIKAAIADGRVT